MISTYKCVNAALASFEKRRDYYKKKKAELKQWCNERYPVDVYGARGEEEYDKRVRVVNDDIREMNMYIDGLIQLMEAIEVRERGKKSS